MSAKINVIVCMQYMLIPVMLLSSIVSVSALNDDLVLLIDRNLEASLRDRSLSECDSLDIVFEVLANKFNCRDTAFVAVRNRAADTVHVSIGIDGFRRRWSLFAGIEPLIANEKDLKRYAALHPLAPGEALTIAFPISSLCKRGKKFSRFRLYLHCFAFNAGYNRICMWESREFTVGR